MKIEQIYTGCLAQGAYYIVSDGEAAIIDPLREVGNYLEKAKKDNAKIKYVLETHFHADFVSGHLDLARKTGAKIVYGPTALPNFEAHIAKDGEELKVGRITLKVLHTPGHTLESVTYLLKNEEGKDYALFTGDTLFLGDVGRPDLAQKSDLTMNDLAGMLFDSLRNKIMTLPDDIIVYPAHGAGSACGKNMMKETVDTLGNQKRMNYALRENMTKEEFIKEVTSELPPAPAYFPENVKMNREGYASIDTVLKQSLKSLTAEEFELIANETGALVLDTRNDREFANGFIPNAVNIGIDGGFAPWVGELIPVSQPILIVAEKGREEEVVTRLARIGFDNTLGFLQNGIASWRASGKELDTIKTISATEFAAKYKDGSNKIIDVRKPEEFETGHVSGAINVPLGSLNDHLSEIPKEEEVFVHCAGGYRSMIANSILRSRGWDNTADVEGGFKKIAETDIPKTTVKGHTTVK